MHFLLLLDTIWLPSFGGSIKALCLAAQSIAARAHRCTVLCHAFTRSPEGPHNHQQLIDVLAQRGTFTDRGGTL
jgi:hypothetical protein